MLCAYAHVDTDGGAGLCVLMILRAKCLLTLLVVVMPISGDAHRGNDVRPRHRCGEPHHHHCRREALPVQEDRATRRGLHPHALAPSAPCVRGLFVCLCSCIFKPTNTSAMNSINGVDTRLCKLRDIPAARLLC